MPKRGESIYSSIRINDFPTELDQFRGLDFSEQVTSMTENYITSSISGKPFPETT